VKVEDRQALRFILEDDIYLLNEDKLKYNKSDDPQLPVPQSEIETPKPVFNYLGANKKSFLVLTNYADHDFIADDHLTALESVLGRKSHGREDVAILNTAKNTSEYLAIISHFKPQTLLILGQESVPAGMDQLTFNQVEKRDSLTVLYTFSFDDMMTNTDNKKAFWEQVKSL
jgi:hypothetical protein